ncbi:MAG: c-type cytochrome domain-containing protein, partial [Pirellula sp.]
MSKRSSIGVAKKMPCESLTLPVVRSRWVCLLAVAFGLLSSFEVRAVFLTPDDPNDRLVEFDRDVRPILSDYCFGCHGPDSSARRADLRLDLKEGLYSKSAEHSIVEPHHTERSELIQRIESTDAQFQMPPPSFDRRLSAREKTVIKNWIDQGAA